MKAHTTTAADTIQTKTNAPLKTGAKVVATVIFLLAGCAFVVIAGKINYDASIGQGGYWPWAAIGATVLVAGLLKASLLLFMRRMYVGCIAAALVAAPFFSLNWFTASGNVASGDKLIEETRAAQTVSANALEDSRKDAVKRRDKAEKDADGETEASAKRKIEKMKADNSLLWSKSRHCEQRTKAPTFCDDIDALKNKAEAAVAYEKARNELVSIADQSRLNTISAQSTSKGAGETVKAFASQLSYNMTEEQGQKFFEHQRGGCLELAAAIGPSVAWLLAWLLFWVEDDKAVDKVDARAVVEREPAPFPSIVLPAVPQAPVAATGHPVEEMEPDEPAPSIPLPHVEEAAPAAEEHIEGDAEPGRFIRDGFWTIDTWKEKVPPPPAPPSGGGKRTRKPKDDPRGDNVIQFSAKRKPTREDILALMASGKTQEEIGAMFGCTARTIRNKLSGKKELQPVVFSAS